MAATAPVTDDPQPVKRTSSSTDLRPDMSDDPQPLKRTSSFTFLPPQMCELRVVLLGNSWSERSSLGNFILGETGFNTEEEPEGCVRVRGPLKEEEMVLINTPDLLHPNISEDKLREHVETCLRLSDPGPHVFLVVLNPKDFTEEHKLRLCRVLKLFGDQSFDQCLISTPREDSPGFMDRDEAEPLKDIIRQCQNRYLDQKNLDHAELLTRLGQIAKENSGENVSSGGFEDAGLIVTPSGHITPALNLVLCGTTGAGKTSAAKAILGGTELHPASSSECVRHQGEVCGRLVSLVELPALTGKPQEEVMEQSFRCISLCDPEGVHAFILVLPVGPLTDEDKAELETIQNTFGSGVSDFTMILFTVDSDPSASNTVQFINKDNSIQELCRSCGGRRFLLNIRDQQQIPDLLDDVEEMRGKGSRCFTTKMFTKAQVGEVSKLKAELQDVKQSMMPTEGYEEIQPREKEEMKREYDDLQRKHKEELKTQKISIKEEERKLREKQLQEKDKIIDKEREQRKKEREEEEKRRKKQGESQLEWRRKLEASEKMVQTEKEQRENAEKKLEQCRKEHKRERDAWDKERKEFWTQKNKEDKEALLTQLEEEKKRLEEEKRSHRTLQEKYNNNRRLATYALVALLLVLTCLLCYIFQSLALTTESTKTQQDL